MTVHVYHNTINAKASLAINVKGPVGREIPMVTGIDLVGTGKRSES